MTLVVKRVSEAKLRELRAEAARRGITLSKAVEEAIDLWLTLSRRSRLDEEEAANNKEYERLRSSGELDRARGRYVVIAGGRLLGYFDTLEGASRAIAESGARKALVFRPGVDDREADLEWAGGSMRRLSA